MPDQHESPVPAGRTAALLVCIGALGFAAQVILLRELLAAFAGNEFTAGIMVAAWVLAEALGAWLASRMTPTKGRLSAAAVLSFVTSVAAIPAVMLARATTGSVPGETASIPFLLLVTFGVTLLPAAAHGALFVLAAAGSNRVGRAYAWEGAGTVIAALVASFLLGRVPGLAIVALMALPLAIAIIQEHRWMSLPLAILAVSAVFGAAQVENWTLSRYWRGQEVRAVTESPYGRTVTLVRADQVIVARDGVPEFVAPETDVARDEELGIVPLLATATPRRALIIGLGIGGLARAALRLPIDELVCLELDPALLRAAAAVADPAETRDPRIKLVAADPVAYLRDHDSAFDCIIFTRTAPATLAASRLFTGTFYALCRTRLSPQGIIAIPGPGSTSGLTPDVAGVLATRTRTLAQHFASVTALPLDFPLILGSNAPLPPAETLCLRLAALPDRPVVLDSFYLAGLLDPWRDSTLAAAIRAAAGPQPSPSGELYLNLVREQRLVSPGFGRAYAALGRINGGWWWLALLPLALIAILAGRRGRGPDFAVFTSGFAGAAVSILALFVWQLRFGSLYSSLGLLIAAFMLGTVYGGWLGSRGYDRNRGRPGDMTVLRPSQFLLSDNSSRVPGPGQHRPSASRLPLILADTGLAASALALLLLARSGPAPLIFAANGAAGFCLGLQFAVAGAAGGSSVSRRTGTLTALDLEGGFAGGLLTALVFVPVYGIAAASLAVVGVKAASLAGLALTGRRL